jgi:hypothetical protein
MNPQDNQLPEQYQNNPLPHSTQASNTPTPGATPQVVYLSRPMEPYKPVITPEIQKKHEESMAKYPYLNLSEGEFIVSAVDRHLIGELQIWSVVVIIILLTLGMLYVFSGGVLTNSQGLPLVSAPTMGVPAALFAVLTLLFGFIAASIYNANKFFLTNESVIQYIQNGLFSKRQQTVSLSNIEDASYGQHGILPTMFNYGQIRLSTEGDETTYRFSYARQPEKQVAILNNAVEAFKNGRPIVND